MLMLQIQYHLHSSLATWQCLPRQYSFSSSAVAYRREIAVKPYSTKDCGGGSFGRAVEGEVDRARSYQVVGGVSAYHAYDGYGELGFDSAEKA